MRGSFALPALVVAVIACTTSYPPCYRGEYRSCTCGEDASRGAGYQICSAAADGYEACVCDGTTPGLDGGRDASDAGGAADATAAADADQGAAYLTPCGAGGACRGAEALCFTFGNKGKVCTRRCSVAADCPAPSLGCSPNNGVCRPP